MMYVLLPIFSTLFACKEPVAETPVHLQTEELGNASTLRALFNNTSGDSMVVLSMSLDLQFLENLSHLLSMKPPKLLTDSYGVATLSLDGNTNSGSATWTDQRYPFRMSWDTLPAIIGYEATSHLPVSRFSIRYGWCTLRIRYRTCASENVERWHNTVH